MNIMVFGAGAIGSLFGALLSQDNTVVLIGRQDHVQMIRSKGLKITGKSSFHKVLKAVTNIEHISFQPDLILLTVKSYQTYKAIELISSSINENTIILTFQNGLDNIEHIKKFVNRGNIIAGVTTHGAIFQESGEILHAGMGWTIIGELNGRITNRVKEISEIINKAGIKTSISSNIIGDIWKKAIINSSINPLTALFKCKNGYLLQNPFLEKLVDKICEESTITAQSNGLDFSIKEMQECTKRVIRQTSDNYSSMYQSIQKHKKTEISSINGVLVSIGKLNGCNIFFNEILTYIIEQMDQ